MAIVRARRPRPRPKPKPKVKAPVYDPIRQPLSYDQLQQQVADMVASQIKTTTAPLEAQQAGLATREEQARQTIAAREAALMPYVQKSAESVGNSYASALEMEQGIFQAAGQRMNSLKQDQAAQAQKLAQEMGGPVATGEFTAVSEPYIKAAGEAGASEMMHGLGLAQAGEQASQAFAGKVFPALMTEEQTKARTYFEDQIKDLQKEIDQNIAGKSSLIGSALSEALDKERTFALNIAESKRAKLQADRDWKATRAQLRADQVRLGLSKKASQISEAGVTGRYKGKPTQQAKRQAAELRLEAQRLGLSVAAYQTRLAQATESKKAAASKNRTNQTANAMDIIDSAMNPNGGKPITLSTKAYIKKGSTAERFAAIGRTADAHYDPKRKQWYTYERLTLTPSEWAKEGGYTGPTPISDPNRLYDLVRGAVPGLPKAVVINLVRAKTGQPNWTPGSKTSYTGSELHMLTKDELIGLAGDRGLRRIGRDKWSKQRLIDYILHHNPR